MHYSIRLVRRPHLKRLTNQEAQSLLDAVSLLHAHQGTDDVHDRILKAVKLVSAAEWYALDSFHPQGYWLNQNWQMPLNSATSKDVDNFGRHVHEHPLFTAFLETGLPEPRQTTDYVSAQQFQRSAIYNEFFRPVGTDRQLLTGLPVSSTLTLVLSLNRKRRDFTESSRQLLTMLRPNIITAYQNAAAFTDLRLHQAQLEVALEWAGAGAILFDMNGHEELVTEQARVCLQKYFGAPHNSATDLPEELTDWMKHNVSVAMLEQVLAVPVPPLEIVSADSRLCIRMLIDCAARRVLLLMKEDLPVSAKALEMLGLTKREAEVLSWVMLGKSSPEIAILCSISQRTVQKHLEHIYMKLGVSSRSAAAQLALEMLQRNS